MIEKDGMHSFSYRVVATEGEREIGDSAGGAASGQVVFYPCYSADEIHTVIVMFFQSCTNGENVNIKDDIFRMKSGFPGQ